jgi:hypothetical protein
MNTAFERDAQKDEWLTPKFITDALAPFDLDPCASIVRPWEIARRRFTREDNGLMHQWGGDFVFCNPPYGNETAKWFGRMMGHNHGIALTFARTETRMFFESVWPCARAVFFFKGRLSFCDTSGKPGGTAGAPSVLIAYGKTAFNRLLDASVRGKLVGKFIEL